MAEASGRAPQRWQRLARSSPDDRQVPAPARRARLAASDQRAQWLGRAGGPALARGHSRCGHPRYAFLRGERSARWLGAKTQRPLSWILVKLKRNPVDDGAGKAAELRTQALAVLREGWALGSIGVAANLFLTYLILLAALRFVGVSSAELSAPDAFAAFAIAFLAGAVLPITGSGLGVVDTVLIAMLIELSGASGDALVAAALLWRVFYSVPPLPLGAITLSRFRKPLPQGESRVVGRDTAKTPLA